MPGRRDSANAYAGSVTVSSCDDDLLGGHRGGLADLQPEPARRVHDAPLAVLAEGDRLAVLEPDQRLVAGVGLLEQVERAVVEDVAVLVDLDERRALVLGGRAQDLLEVLAVGVDGTGDEARLGPERERDRVERRVRRARPASTW